MTTLVTGGTGMVGTNIKDIIDVKVSDFVFLSSAKAIRNFPRIK